MFHVERWLQMFHVKTKNQNVKKIKIKFFALFNINNLAVSEKRSNFAADLRNISLTIKI